MRVLSPGIFSKLFQQILALLIMVLISMSMLFSCDREDTMAQAEPPGPVTQIIQDFQTNNPSCTCHPAITQYIWKNKNVFVVSYNDTQNTTYVCDWVPVYFNASGKPIRMLPGYTYHDFLSDARLFRVVWAC